MSEPYSRQHQRDEAIRAMLPLVPSLGWTGRALRDGAGGATELLFPGGAAELVEAYVDLADREMVAGCADAMDGLGLTRRVRMLMATRLTQAAPHREAVRRAVGVLSQPGNAAVAARCTAGTVDAVWVAAGDQGEGVSWYSKRAILASVYATTLLYWLRPGGPQEPDGLEEALAFLDRRLADVGRIGKLRARLSRRPG